MGCSQAPLSSGRKVSNPEEQGRIRRLQVNERVQVRRANSNDWIPGVIVSALQYFGVVGEGYEVQYDSGGRETMPASPQHIQPTM
ncbi:uncharacterized protein SCHCODRAFT_02626893 [Schizophyllum commune H4-8]|nr:uncharacterized protein SCHCODRAFT_02626893 [Schizophyllum commune H4-8]KAI5892700.1 hypothetical protein SCHCODRAFT_02626893 [Schizophyllum commune H4-8]